MLVAVPLGVMAVDFNQTFKFAAVLLEEPCGFNRAAPYGGKSEMLNTVLSKAGDEAFHILVPDHFADVEVIVAAVPLNFVLVKRRQTSLPSSLSSSQTGF